MDCLICGAKLTKQDICLSCGTDIRLYREIIQTSNQYYNLGLEHAKRRDLTGARTALMQCLNLNKRNIEARNLLGLVYYELGEIVFALREWVISKNFQEKDNLADYYLQQAEHIEKVLSGNIHRYNNALHYLEIGSRDLALIQLKRIASKPYKNVKAFQLLALLYMEDGLYSKAERLLKRCQDIDNGDPTTLRYMEALREHKKSAAAALQEVRNEAGEQANADGVIMPVTAVREINSYFVYVMYMAIGFIIGVLLIYFVVVPSVRAMEQSNTKALLLESERQNTNLSIDILKLQAEKEKFNDKIAELQDKISQKDDSVLLEQTQVNKLKELIKQYKVLLTIMDAYLEEDYLTAMSAYLDLNATYENDETYREIFTALKQDMTNNMWYRLYYTGVKKVNAQEYEVAAQMLAQSFQLYAFSPETLFYLGFAHENMGNKEEMADAYRKIIALFPDTVWAQNAKDRLGIYGLKW